jgi:hypothetical protein
MWATARTPEARAEPLQRHDGRQHHERVFTNVESHDRQRKDRPPRARADGVPRTAPDRQHREHQQQAEIERQVVNQHRRRFEQNRVREIDEHREHGGPRPHVGEHQSAEAPRGDRHHDQRDGVQGSRM